METMLHFWEGNRYWILFWVVLMDVLGVPGPAIPFLFVAGTLAAAGQMSLALIVLLATMTSAFGDVLWYGLGRIGGKRILNILSRLTAKKEADWERCLNLAAKYSVSFLVISKFIPGIATLAPPAAGIVSMPLAKFLLVDTLGRAVWAGGFSWVGYFLTTRGYI